LPRILAESYNGYLQSSRQITALGKDVRALEQRRDRLLEAIASGRVTDKLRAFDEYEAANQALAAAKGALKKERKGVGRISEKAVRKDLKTLCELLGEVTDAGDRNSMEYRRVLRRWLRRSVESIVIQPDRATATLTIAWGDIFGESLPRTLGAHCARLQHSLRFNLRSG
jgi:hypothetical protein